MTKRRSRWRERERMELFFGKVTPRKRNGKKSALLP
jgi:hypothetical protein